MSVRVEARARKSYICQLWRKLLDHQASNNWGDQNAISEIADLRQKETTEEIEQGDHELVTLL